MIQKIKTIDLLAAYHEATLEQRRFAMGIFAAALRRRGILVLPRRR